MENKSLILLLSGNKDKIIAAHNLDASNLDVVKIDEKDLINFSLILNTIKSKKYKQIIFSVYSNNYLRFSFFMKLYLLLTNNKGFIIDEFGNKITFSTFVFIFKDTPIFITEVLFSFFIVLFYQLKFINK